MSWKIAQAKQHLSDVIRQAAKEPQVLMNRDRVVAAVVGAEEFEQFQEWRARRSLGSIAEALTQARQICTEEDYALDLPARGDRENPILKRSRAPARHKRHQ